MLPARRVVSHLSRVSESKFGIQYGVLPQSWLVIFAMPHHRHLQSTAMSLKKPNPDVV